MRSSAVGPRPGPDLARAQAQVRVKAQTDNVAGVRIPKFEEVVTGGEAKMALTGLGKGGQQVQQCRKVRTLLLRALRLPIFPSLSSGRDTSVNMPLAGPTCPSKIWMLRQCRSMRSARSTRLIGCACCITPHDAMHLWSIDARGRLPSGQASGAPGCRRGQGDKLKQGAHVRSAQAFLKSVALLVELASLQTAFLTLDEAIKTTNRRVNALDNVVRPRLENTISYIKV